MNISTAKTIVKIAIAANQPLLVIGNPGVGKSSIIQQAAEETGISFIDVRVSQLEAIDLRGIPTVKDGVTTWNPPDFLPTRGAGILCLDELTSATPSMQTACYQLILDRRLGDYVLPPKWSIVAAGNKISDRAVVYPMSSALKNRFMTIEVESDLDAWKAWALSNDIDPIIIGFLNFRPELLNVFNSNKIDHNQHAFATERSWVALNRALPHTDPKYRSLIATGLVGQGAGIEFSSFYSLHSSLPELKQILLTPLTTPVPSRPDALYAVSSMLSYHATVTAFPTMMTYIARLPLEFQVLTMRDMLKRTPIISTTKAFGVWAASNTDVIFG